MVVLSLVLHPVFSLSVYLPRHLPSVHSHQYTTYSLTVLKFQEGLSTDLSLLRFVVNLVKVGLISEEHQYAVIDLPFFILSHCVGRNKYLISVFSDFIVVVVKIGPKVSIKFADY